MFLKEHLEQHFWSRRWISKSFANCIPASKALASTSRAPRGALIFLLQAPTTFPSASRTSTPIPVAFCAPKTAPLTFIL